MVESKEYQKNWCPLCEKNGYGLFYLVKLLEGTVLKQPLPDEIRDRTLSINALWWICEACCIKGGWIW